MQCLAFPSARESSSACRSSRLKRTPLLFSTFCQSHCGLFTVARPPARLLSSYVLGDSGTQFPRSSAYLFAMCVGLTSRSSSRRMSRNVGRDRLGCRHRWISRRAISLRSRICRTSARALRHVFVGVLVGLESPLIMRILGRTRFKDLVRASCGRLQSARLQLRCVFPFSGAASRPQSHALLFGMLNAAVGIGEGCCCR